MYKDEEKIITYEFNHKEIADIIEKKLNIPIPNKKLFEIKVGQSTTTMEYTLKITTKEQKQH